MPEGVGRRAAIGVGVVVAVLLIAFLLTRLGDDTDEGGGHASPETSTPTAAPVASDEQWCATWQAVVQVQAQYVASQSEQDRATLLQLVDDLRAMGYPESLDEAGYTELAAVLDDLQASADPSFTPSIQPSEPADVPTGDDHGHGHDGRGAPFGSFLAEHCPA